MKASMDMEQRESGEASNGEDWNTPATQLPGNNRYPSRIGGFDHAVAVQKKTFARVHSKAGSARFLHCVNRLQSNHRHVKTHVLVGLGHLDHGQRAAQDSANTATAFLAILGAL